MKKESTKQKLQNLIRDLVAEYGEGAVVNTKTVYEKAKSSPSYCTYYMLTANPVYKLGRGKIFLTMKQNVEEAKAKLAKTSEAKKQKQLPQDVRKSAVKLAKTLINHKPKQVVQKNYSAVDYVVTQDDINDSFGGNDINDILAQL